MVRDSFGTYHRVEGHPSATIQPNYRCPYFSYGQMTIATAPIPQKEHLPPPLTHDMYVQLVMSVITAGKRMELKGVAIVAPIDLFPEGSMSVQSTELFSPPPGMPDFGGSVLNV